MPKNIKLIAYLVSGLLVINSAFADTNSDYAKSIDNKATTGAKNGSPWTVPNYAEPHPDYDNLMYDGDQLKIEGKNASTTNEAAQVIYNLPHSTINQSDSWYQNANNTTSNPSAALPTTTETSCTTTTTPGGTITTTQSCITSETATNETCKTPVQVTVDADYDYECHKNRQSTGQNCQVGHLIDVTKSWNYQCTKTQVYQDNTCQQYWEIVQSVNLTCDSGWILSQNNGQNICYTVASYYCNSGSTDTGSNCSTTTTTSVILTCPPGYTLGSATHPSCLAPMPYPDHGTLVTAPTKSCPSGYTINGSTCMKTTSSPYNYTCPAGSTVSTYSNGSVICTKSPYQAMNMVWHDECGAYE